MAMENRLNYARILIEVDEHFSYPSTIQLQLYNGHIDDVQVEYEHKFIPCAVCNVYGHSDSSCNKVIQEEMEARE